MENNLAINDLIDQMSRATTPVTTPPPPPLDTTTGTAPTDQDFDPPTPENTPPADVPGDNETDFDGEEMAEGIVDLIDMICEEGLKHAYQHSHLTKEERRRLRVISRSVKNRSDITSLSDDDRNLLEISDDIDDLIEEAPLDDRERERLQKAMKKVMAGKTMKMSPETALLLTTIIIMLPRIIPIFTAMMEKKTRNETIVLDDE